jgi:hypothetical protein
MLVSGNIWMCVVGRAVMNLSLGNTGLMMTTLAERVPANRILRLERRFIGDRLGVPEQRSLRCVFCLVRYALVGGSERSAWPGDVVCLSAFKRRTRGWPTTGDSRGGQVWSHGGIPACGASDACKRKSTDSGSAGMTGEWQRTERPSI